jgi:UDP-N-acetyl-D-mannosaminuronic acid dehydrogenase
VGTTERLAELLAHERPDLLFPQHAGDAADVQIAYCPERILPGCMLHELVANDRVVGGMSDKAARMAASLYKIFVKGNISVTDARTAELCKLAENSFRDVNIAFANELSMICDKFGIDVWELIRLANRHPRVSILQPGPGVGGHCIAVDPWFIVDGAPEEAQLIRKAREVNDYKSLWILDKIKTAISDTLAAAPGMTMADIIVACLGLAFKPDVDDLRESPALRITQALARLGCRVLAVEPHIDMLPQALISLGVKGSNVKDALDAADVVCLLVRHTHFRGFTTKIASHNRVIDTTGLLTDDCNQKKQGSEL